MLRARTFRNNLLYEAYARLFVALAALVVAVDYVARGHYSTHESLFAALFVLWAAFLLNALAQKPQLNPRYLWQIDRPAECLITDLRAVIRLGRGYEWSIFLDQIPVDVLATQVHETSDQITPPADAHLILNLAKLRALFQDDTARAIAIAALERMLDGTHLPTDLHVQRWTGRPERRIWRLALGRGEVAGNFFLAGLLIWNFTPNKNDVLNRTFIITFVAIGILRQVAAVRTFRRRWSKTGYLVTSTRLELLHDHPAGSGTGSGYLTDLTPPAQLGPKASLRLAHVRTPARGKLELFGLADPEQLRRQILTAQLTARSLPAAGRPPAEPATSAPAPVL